MGNCRARKKNKYEDNQNTMNKLNGEENLIVLD